MVSEKTGVPEGYRTPPPREKYWATWALVERERGGQGWPRAPSPSGPNWTRRGGGAPLSFSLSLSFLPPSPFRWEPTRTWSPSRIPLLGARHRGPAGLPLAPLYTGAGGHPRDTTIDH